MNNGLMRLERAIHALDGLNHGISSAVETESGITPMQIYCLMELVSGALNQALLELKEQE